MKKKNILWIAVTIIMILALTLMSACTCSAPTTTTPTNAPTSTSTPTPTPTPTPTITPDGTIPTVTSTIHANGATGVAINAKVGAFFSEAMNPETLTTATFTVMQGTTLVAGTVSYIGVAATFTPSANLSSNTEYVATISTGAMDWSGNALANPYTWKWTTGAAPDVTAPTVSSSIPASGATGVAINSAMSTTFSEAMDPETLNTTTFTLMQGTTPVAGTVTYILTTATFTPSGSLAPSTTYTAKITTGAKDLAGNPMAADKVWTFTTGVAPDTTAPTVSSTIPANGASYVIVPAITATFSEAMDPLTVTNTTFTLQRGTTTLSGVVTYVGVTATFTPDVALVSNILHTATISTWVRDLNGNQLASNYVWSFTPGISGGGGGGSVPPADTTAPLVNSTIPASGATGVATNSSITATFSEAMAPLTITSDTFTLLQGVVVVPGAVTYTGLTALFNPDDNLLAGTDYTARVSTVVTDLAGNHLAVDKVWTFTTASPDTSAPTVSSTVPLDDATGVATNSNVTAIFSEAMDPLTTTTDTFTVMQGAVVVLGTVTYDGFTVTFNPDANLLNNTEYTAKITTGVTDLAGNALAGDEVWNFTTAPVNPTAPVMGETANFVILASQKVTTAPGADGASAISDGDIGILDQARTYYEGFTPGAAIGEFDELINGLSYAGDDIDASLNGGYATPIAYINQIRTDLGIAYTFLAADPNMPVGAPTQVCPAELGGETLTRGVYKTGVDVSISTPLYLDAQGDPDSVWIFSIDGTLTTGVTGDIILQGGAQAQNVYWRVSGVTTIAAGTAFFGNVFAWAQINVLDSANVTGRLFSVNEQVTLIGDIVTMP